MWGTSVRHEFLIPEIYDLGCLSTHFPRPRERASCGLVAGLEPYPSEEVGHCTGDFSAASRADALVAS